MTRLAIELEHHLDALRELFRGEAVTDVHLQPNGHIWAGKRYVEGSRVSLEERRLIARYLGTHFEHPLTKQSPTFSNGPLVMFGKSWRVTVTVPPTTREEAVTFRRIADKPIPIWQFGASQADRDLLLSALERRMGVLVIGQQGSGKTAFSTALLNLLIERHQDLRIALIEDTREIQLPSKCNHTALVTSEHRSLEDLVTEGLRTGADLVIIGEVRDRAVTHLVTAAVTGHGALTTFHAASPRTAYERIKLLMQMSGNVISDPYIVHAAFPIVARLENRKLVEVHRHEGVKS